MGKKLFLFLFFVLLVATGYVLIAYYSHIFARTIVGRVENIQKVTEPVTILGGHDTGFGREAIFSFAVAIKDSKTNEIVTGSTEDRQWAVVQAGKCAEAKFFPYPPWDLEAAGTYHNVRLIRLFDCLEEEKK